MKERFVYVIGDKSRSDVPLRGQIVLFRYFDQTYFYPENDNLPKIFRGDGRPLIDPPPETFLVMVTNAQNDSWYAVPKAVFEIERETDSHYLLPMLNQKASPTTNSLQLKIPKSHAMRVPDREVKLRALITHKKHPDLWYEPSQEWLDIDQVTDDYILLPPRPINLEKEDLPFPSIYAPPVHTAKTLLVRKAILKIDAVLQLHRL